MERLADTEPGQARTQLLRCLGEVAGPPSAYRLLASLEEDAGRREAALRTLSRAVALHPTDAHAWLSLGRLHLLQDHGAEGLGALGRARELRSGDPVFERAWRDALASHGPDIDRRIARLAPRLAEIDGHYELGEFDEARSLLEQVLAIAEGIPSLQARARLRGALIELAAEQPEQAAEHVRLGLDGAREAAVVAELEMVASELALRRESWSEAAMHAEAALEHVPEHPLAAVNLAVAEVGRGRLEVARARYLEALGSGISSRIDEATFRTLPGVEALALSSSDFEQAVRKAFLRPD